MPRIDVRRTLAVLLLVLTLTPAVSWAGERRPPGPREVVILGGRLLPALWGFIRSVWEKAGASLDPDGQPRPNEGASLDPSGSTADEGSSLDPSG